MEDLTRPLAKRRFTYIGSFRIVRPVWKFARFTYRASRFVARQAAWVLLGDRKAKQELHHPNAPEVTRETA